MIKQADQLGASLLGRVSPRMEGNSFSSADRGGYDADFNNRLLQNLINRGISVLDKSIDAELENEMVKGATQAMAGVAEENLETSILTKNFTIAGHRNMTAKMHHQSWQAQILDEIAKGEHNNLSPTEFASYLNTSMQEVLNDVSGMSMDAKSSMLETMLTGNQTIVAQQTKHRAESIVNASMGLYSMQANNLLEQAKINQGTDLEGVTIQQIQAFMRAVDADPNLTQDVKSKFMGEYIEGSAKLGLVNVTQGIRATVLGYNEDGSPITYQDKMGTDQYIKSVLEENKAIKANRWVNNTEGRVAFSELSSQIEAGTFSGTRDDLVSAIRFARINEIIPESEANTLFNKFIDNEYLERYSAQLSEAYRTNNQKEFQRLKSNMGEGRKAYLKEGVDMGLSIPEQISRINTTFKLSNGDTNAVDYIGETFLKPILNEIINSDGEILTENGQVLNQIVRELRTVDETKQKLYLSSLLGSLDSLQADFMYKFIGDQLNSGASPESALIGARVSYTNSLSAKEADRSEAVRQSSTTIDKVVADFTKVGKGNNFLLNRTIGSLWNERDQVYRIAGSPTFFRTEYNNQVATVYSILGNGIKADLKEHIRKVGRPLSEAELAVEADKSASKRIKGDTSGNFVLFGGVEGIDRMLGDSLTTELRGQENDLMAYMVKTLSAGDGYESVNRTYAYEGGLLKAYLVNSSGQPITLEYSPEDYLQLVDKYKGERFSRVQEGDWGQEVYKLSKQATKTQTYFDKVNYNFNTAGYDNSYRNYSRKFISELYQDTIPLEGMKLKRYSDGSNGKYSIGLAVNSSNATDPRYKPYFDLEKKQGYLTKEQAEELSEIAVKDHLNRSTNLIVDKLGKEYLGVSNDFEKAIFKLTYVGSNNVTDSLMQAVKEGDVEGVISSLQNTPFFKRSANGRTDNQHYQYILSKLIGAMDDFSTRGIR